MHARSSEEHLRETHMKGDPEQKKDSKTRGEVKSPRWKFRKKYSRKGEKRKRTKGDKKGKVRSSLLKKLES